MLAMPNLSTVKYLKLDRILGQQLFAKLML